MLEEFNRSQSKSELEVKQTYYAPIKPSKPAFRRLRGYAYDPSLSSRLDTSVINETVYKIPWEGDDESPLLPGPVGEYLEVVDYDPASECFYNPVDLNHPYLLAEDGFAPSEGNPQFHQQMVYAVAMTTIRNFERALGRPALWSVGPKYQFVPRLRIYPHALREANAYYSPEKKALLFGYFPAISGQPGKFLPGSLTFTCLSHDVIAHETTHALLDGMYERFVEANHYDSLAFHEAFADIVALFQHFSFPDVLKHQIGRTRGNLSSQNLLGELAQQFGEAIGSYGALRSAIGRVSEKTGQWEPIVPNPDEILRVTEPHARGAILVAAVFDTFLAIYNRRVADLFRLASSGTGILPEGELHPDLVNRLAEEAAKVAQHILTACIRALDYCPPVDITFGDYLRAIITADSDIVPNDEWGYRIAFFEAFRRRGIYPRDLPSVSPENLRWPKVDTIQGFFEPLAEQLRHRAEQFRYLKTREEIFTKTARIAKELNSWICAEGKSALSKFGEIAGIRFDMSLRGLRTSDEDPNVPKFQIHSLRPAKRVSPDGRRINQLIISIVQTRDEVLDETKVKRPAPANTQKVKKAKVEEDGDSNELLFRGGSTLILDLDTMQLQYAIKKDIGDPNRLSRYRNYRKAQLMRGDLWATYFSQIKKSDEPFAFLHRNLEEGGPE